MILIINKWKTRNTKYLIGFSSSKLLKAPLAAQRSRRVELFVFSAELSQDKVPTGLGYLY